MKPTVLIALLVLVGLAGLCRAAEAAEKDAPTAAPAGRLAVADIFADHAVLQRNRPVRVWGTAPPGAEVTVRFAGQSPTATTDKQGRWRLELEAMDASCEPRKLTVTAGRQAITLDDVLVGEVWLFSGQSNMAFGMRGTASFEQAKATADRKSVRFSRGDGWKVASAKNLANTPAVSFHFAMALHDAMKVPVGVITPALGGTSIHRWISLPVIEADPWLREHAVERWKQYRRDYPALVKRYEELKEQGDTRTMPARPQKPDAEPPGDLYDRMIAPLVGYALTGFAWYQGESDAWGFPRAMEYEPKMCALIRGWRQAWDMPEAPFLIVQLPNYDGPVFSHPPQPSPWSYVQDVHARMARELDNVAVVVTGDWRENDIHPKRKDYIGERLARAARGLAYGEDIVYSGPVLKRMEIHGRTVRLSFDHAEGLQAGGGLTPAGEPLEGFAVAGEDREFFWADARIDGNQVVLTVPEKVATPAAVRYGFYQTAKLNLYNDANLPAGPFRTDDWGPDLPQKPKPSASAARATGTIAIDGVFGPGEWPKAEPLSGFRRRHSYRPAEYPSEVQLAWDEKNLYLAAHCALPGREPVITAGEADEKDIVWGEAFEILLDTDNDGLHYKRIVIDPAGTIMDGRGYNASASGPLFLSMKNLAFQRWFYTDWSSGATAACKVQDRNWRLELAIPFKALGVEPKTGVEMGMQLIRHAATGRFEDKNEAIVANETSQWATTGRDAQTGAMMPTEKHVHSPARFGTLKLK